MNFCTKPLLVMKLTILFLTLCCLHVAAASYGQQITLSEKDAPLEKVFKDITKQTGYIFFTEKNTLQGTNKVTLTLNNASLDETLKTIFAGQPLEYTIAGTTIAVKKKETPTIQPKKLTQNTPPTDVIGRVTNEQNQPLNGATVTIRRTQTGTLTDANGNFTVRGVASSDTLVISYLGYTRAFIRISDQTSLKVVLKAATNQLDQVVVQAYGETSQRLTTGDIGKVTAAQIAKQPVMNVLEALQGQVPGVIVTNTSGYASGAVKVEIRGRNAIGNFPSDPLYIIDGVPLTILDLTKRDSYNSGSQGVIQSGILSPANGQSPFFSINPADIESIEVLKDADATAIYGSRGSNGVILITTKKGKAGKTHLDMNIHEGISEVTRHYALLNTQQYVAMREEALRNDGLPLNINTAPDIVAWGTTRYTDWQKYLWGGLGRNTIAEASLSGGDERTTFRIGAGYNEQTEILTSTGSNQRGSLSFNLNHKSLNQRFNLVFSGTYTLVSSNMIYTPGAITLPPNAPAVFDGKGNLNFAGWTPLDGNFPFGSLLQPYTIQTNLLNSNMVLSYVLLKGLVLKTNFGYNNIQGNQTRIIPIASQDPAYNPKGSSTFGSSLIHNLVIEPQLEYNSLINKGKLDVLLGASTQSNSTSSTYLSGEGYTNDALLQSITNAPIKTGNNSFGEYKYDAIFGRINYDWENKYILNLNARRDGSSHFGPGRQFGNFGSVGTAWIFSEENAVKKYLPLLSFGKLRASYGTSGGDQIGNYAFLSQWIFSQDQYNNILPLTPLGHTDSLLHWQVNRKLEAALDLGFLTDRITLEIAWYRDRCSDQLVQFPTPAFTGFNSVTSNSPAEVQNTGWEFVVNSKIIDNSNFKWSTKFNIGFNHNKLLAYPNLSQSPYADIFEIGQPLNIKKVLHYIGIDPQTGLYDFKDKNNDGKIIIDYSGATPDDRYPVDFSPKFDGGFTSEFTYKNWQLSAFFYFKKQLGLNALASLDAPGDATNQPVNVLNRWQSPGNVTTIARFTANPYANNSFQYYQDFSDAVYTDASFIRLQNLAIYYTLPRNLSKKLGFGNCKIYTQGQNLFLFTKYKGVDPEVQSYGGLPLARIITMGLSCNF